MRHEELFYYTEIKTPLGNLGLVSSSKGLVRIMFSPSDHQNILKNLKWIESQTANEAVIAQLQEYFQGKRKEFSLPLDLRGTPFQIKVWRALQKVRYGETATYGEIARKIGKPNAFRAVGNACGANPIPIVIPCHRIIGKNGDLTGFAGGLEIKRQLLEFEANTK